MKINAKNLKTDPLGEALSRSDDMRPYVDLHAARITRKPTQALESTIRNLPYEKRYVHRLTTNLDLALADLDTETLKMDLAVLPIEKVAEIIDALKFRFLQLQHLVSVIGILGNAAGHRHS